MQICVEFVGKCPTSKTKPWGTFCFALSALRKFLQRFSRIPLIYLEKKHNSIVNIWSFHLKLTVLFFCLNEWRQCFCCANAFAISISLPTNTSICNWIPFNLIKSLMPLISASVSVNFERFFSSWVFAIRVVNASERAVWGSLREFRRSFWWLEGAFFDITARRRSDSNLKCKIDNLSISGSPVTVAVSVGGDGMIHLVLIGRFPTDTFSDDFLDIVFRKKFVNGDCLDVNSEMTHRGRTNLTWIRSNAYFLYFGRNISSDCLPALSVW